MHSFSKQATRLIKEYKSLVKKQSSDSAKKLQALGLNKRISSKEVELHRIMVQIVSFEQNESPQNNNLRYSGLTRFVSDLKTFTQEYEILNGKVIHVGRTVSRALIEAVQYVALAEHRLVKPISDKLEQCVWVVAKFGSEIQKNHLLNALKTHLPRCPNFFEVHLNQYSNHLAAIQTARNFDNEQVAC